MQVPPIRKTTSPRWCHLWTIQARLPWRPPFSQHILWQCCNLPDILSSMAEILLFNSVFHDGVAPVSVSTLKPPLGARYLDLWWEYKNIWIKKGNEWKTAFITLKGLFEPTILFFGLTNSLATFQTMTLWKLINTGEVASFIDNVIVKVEEKEKHNEVV